MNHLGERPAAAKRARWLAELAAAVDAAQRVAQALSVSRDRCAEAEILFGRLDELRIEVAVMRGAGGTARPAQFDPRWTSLFPGARGAGI